ncbi:MAG: DoxX family protein [Mycobacterium kyogaense]
MSTPWHPLTRIAFRFCVVYFGLFCLLFAQILFVYVGVLARWLPSEAVIWQMTLIEPALTWVGQHVFGVDAVLHRDSGSGDQAVIWVMLFVLLAISVPATVVWSIVDRRRESYPRLYAWFSVFVRLCLGGQLLFYGIAKVIPTQMPAPPLAALLQPFGELTPASVLWLQVGTSLPYEIALGTVELVAGLLLFWNRTATLGALVAAMAMAQVFLLNLSYDVPVKILSSHLLLLSLFLLAPQARRLADLLVFQRPTDPAIPPPLFVDARKNRIAATVVAVLGVWALAGCVVGGVAAWRDYGGGREKPELYGIWEVTRPEAAESDWRRVVFDHPGVLTYQRADGVLRDEAVTVGPDGTMSAENLQLRPLRQGPDRLQLAGRIDGRPATLTLHLIDPESFPLRSTEFRWVQDYPRFAGQIN